jgi:lipoprotein signal peptidase
VFNVADAAITVGAVLLLIATFLAEFRDSRSDENLASES